MKADFAILAPVPLEHLVSGKKIAEETGFVAFGSMKWELFKKVDELRGDSKVPVLIYPSHENSEVKLTYIVKWAGFYVGHVFGDNGTHPDKMLHRPPTTEKNQSDNTGFWAIFWHATGLHELPDYQQMPISKIQAHKSGKWRKNTAPRGPELIYLPTGLVLE